jgi:Phospholipase_D-nuclease N-terminal
MLNILLLAQQTSSGDGALVAGGVLFVAILLIAIVGSIFWIWMLVDCLTSSLPSTEKLIWVLVIVFLHFLGALLYFVLARGGRSRAG